MVNNNYIRESTELSVLPTQVEDSQEDNDIKKLYYQIFSQHPDLYQELLSISQNTTLVADQKSLQTKFIVEIAYKLFQFSQTTHKNIYKNFEESLLSKGIDSSYLKTNEKALVDEHFDKHVKVMTGIFKTCLKRHDDDAKIVKILEQARLKWFKNEEKKFSQEFNDLVLSRLTFNRLSGKSTNKANVKNSFDQITRKINVSQQIQQRRNVKLANENYLKNFQNFREQISQKLISEIDPLTEEEKKNLAEAKADLLMQQLIEEEELHSTQQPKKVICKKKKKKKLLTHKPISSSNIEKLTHKVQPAVNLRTNYLLNLQNTPSCFHNHPRVKRWQSKSIQDIRNFSDLNPAGQLVYHYQNLSQSEIIEQRMKHHLPGLDKILTDPLNSKIYSFPTDRGRGMAIELVTSHEQKAGIVYLGIDENNHIFHCYWEHIELENFDFNAYDVFIDHHLKINPFNEEKNLEDQWEMTTPYIFDIDHQGVMTITYDKEDYFIRVYPLRSDLLDKKTFS